MNASIDPAPTGRVLRRLLVFARIVDRCNEWIGWIAAGAVLATCLISAGNAVIRYGWDISSNAWLEIQWYLFAVTVMLGAPYVLRRNEHVRVDIFYSRLTPKGQARLDLFGLVCFLMPMVVLLAVLSWPIFERAYVSGEVSSNAGGLVRWPALALLPLGFALLGIQALAEIIKRIAFLMGHGDIDAQYEKPLQ
jgi:TRAP-type mannitol/chloroaromatic compound transport system permease small subunit